MEPEVLRDSLPEIPPQLDAFLKAKHSRGRVLQQVPQCEKLLFVATKTEELALWYAAQEIGVSPRKCRSDLGLKYLDLGEVNSERILAVRTEMGPHAEGGSAARAIQWRSVTGAQSIISLGMAFGALPDDQHIGDILISEGVLPYDYRIVRTGTDGAPDVDYSEVQAYPSHEGLRRRFQEIASMPAWQQRTWSGWLLSGSARIHCAAFRDELARKCGDKRARVVGGDMESVGLLSASLDRASPCWIAVKAISDFADVYRDEIIEKTRPFACYIAARFVLGALLGHEE